MSGTEISWARTVIDSAGIDLNESPPTNVLGEPNAYTYGIIDETPRVTVADFGGHIGLVELLGAAFAGDKVTAAMLAEADVIAFEHNGTFPAPSGGWESCEWRFSDGQDSLAVRWDASVSANRDPHIVANGSVTGDRFLEVFNVNEKQLLSVNSGARTGCRSC